MGGVKTLGLGVVVLHQLLERSHDHVAVAIALPNGIALATAGTSSEVINIALMANRELRAKITGSLLHELMKAIIVILMN